MDSADDDVSARIILKNVLYTERARTPLTHSASQARRTASMPRCSVSLHRDEIAALTPREALKRTMKQKLLESSSRAALSPSQRRTRSSVARKMSTPAPATGSLLYDDDITPRHLLKGILRTEPEMSLLVQDQPTKKEIVLPSADSSMNSNCTSVGLSGLDLPDLTVDLANTVNKLSRKRPHRSLDVSMFEKKLGHGDDVEIEDSADDLSGMSSTSLSSANLSLKTPFMDARTEKRGLQRKVAKRRKISVEEFDSNVQSRQKNGDTELNVGRALSLFGETAHSDGFTLGMSDLAEPDITNDIVIRNTALYAPTVTMGSSLLIATQDTTSAAQIQKGMEEIENEKERALDKELIEVKNKNKLAEKAGKTGELQEEDNDLTDSHTEKEVVDSQTKDEEASETEEEEADESQTAEEVVAESQTEEEESAESQTDGEEVAVSQTVEEAAESQTAEEEVAESQTEEEEVAESQTEEEEAAASQTVEEAAESQTEGEEAAESQTEGEEAAESQTEEEEAAESQTDGEEAAVSQTAEEEAAVSQTAEEEAAESQTDGEEVGESQTDGEEVAESQTWKRGAAIPQSDQEEPAQLHSEREDYLKQESNMTSQQLPHNAEHTGRRAYRSEGGVRMLAVMEEQRGYRSMGAGVHLPDVTDGLSGQTSEGDTAGKWPNGSDVWASGSGQPRMVTVGSAQISPSLQTRALEEKSTSGAETSPKIIEGTSVSPLELTFEVENNGQASGISHRLSTTPRGPAEQEEWDDMDEDGDEDEADQSKELSMKTPAFVREKRRLGPTEPAPTVLKSNATRTLTGNAAAVKPKTVRKKQPASTKKQTGLPKTYLMSVFKHFAKTNVSADVYPILKEIMDKYFDRLAEDLETFSAHAKRKTIEVEDVELLMRRQGFVTDSMPVNVLIEKYLPMEYRKLLIPVATSGNHVIPKLRR